MQKKAFAEVSLDDRIEGGETVKFGAVVGNPPYQSQNSDRNRDDSIFHHFYDLGFAIAEDTVLITPARFLHNAGSTPKAWNEKILRSRHFAVEQYSARTSDFFTGVDVKGGVAICRYSRNLDVEPTGVFIGSAVLASIFRKVKEVEGENFASFEHACFVQTKFDLTTLYRDFPNLQKVLGSNGRERRITSSVFAKLGMPFKDEKTSRDDVEIYGRKDGQRTRRWISRQYLDVEPNFEKYKILIPAANGTGALGETLSSPVIGRPLTGYSQTFISLGAFETEAEAKACLKYVKSKFFRILLGIKKTTQNNKDPKVWSCIPTQDFTGESDIDWQCEITDIDQRLYTKYDLSEEEISFIEKTVIAMEQPPRAHCAEKVVDHRPG